MTPKLIDGADMVEPFKHDARSATNLGHAKAMLIYVVREVEGLNAP